MTRPSLRQRMSSVVAAGSTLRRRSSARNALRACNWESTGRSKPLALAEASVAAGIPHIVASLWLKASIWPDGLTTRTPSGIDSSTVANLVSDPSIVRVLTLTRLYMRACVVTRLKGIVPSPFSKVSSRYMNRNENFVPVPLPHTRALERYLDTEVLSITYRLFTENKRLSTGLLASCLCLPPVLCLESAVLSMVYGYRP